MNRLMIAFAIQFTGILPLLLDSSLKGAVLLILAAMSVLILRKASAATRHLVWLFAVGALLVLPALSALLPGWAVMPRLNTDAEKSAPSFNSDKLLPSPLGQTVVVEIAPPVTSAARSIRVQEITPTKSFHARDWLMLVWMAGSTLLLIRLVAAQWFLGRAESRCTVVRDGRLAETKQDVLRQLNIRRPVQLLLDSRRTIPMAWGVLRPRVLLPAEAADWDEPRLRAVLLHEMAHIKRGDAVVRWLTQLSCALHWFNPLVWFAAWRLHVESERACDDLVLTNGVRASDYAKHLLHVATNLSPARMTQACGLAMACPSGLEGRLLAVLDQRANRRRVTRALAFAALTLGLCIVIPVAMLRAAPEKTSSDAVVEGRAGNQKSTNEEHPITVGAAETDSPLPGTSAVKPPPTESADAGDNEVNRVKLLHAESEFKRATELRGRNLIPETEFNKAKTEMEIARAELAGRPDEVVRIKLRDAETDLARLAELQKANLVSKDVLDEAKYKVALLRAESRGDTAEAARVQFRQAEAEFKRASQLHKQQLISETEYNDAKQQFELWRAKFPQDEIDTLATTSSTDETQALRKARDEALAKAEAAERVAKIKARLEQMPEKKIPEMQFLTDQEWEMYTARVLGKGETEEDYRYAFSRLREESKKLFARWLGQALHNYAKANNGFLPTYLLQLKPYFTPPVHDANWKPGDPPRYELLQVDDAILQRYQLVQTGKLSDVPQVGTYPPIVLSGNAEHDSYNAAQREKTKTNLPWTEPVIVEKAPVDDQFDSLLTVTVYGYSYKTFGRGTGSGSGTFAKGQVGTNGVPELVDPVPAVGRRWTGGGGGFGGGYGSGGGNGF